MASLKVYQSKRKMEKSNNTMEEEVEKQNCCCPETPAKPTPPRPHISDESSPLGGNNEIGTEGATSDSKGFMGTTSGFGNLSELLRQEEIQMPRGELTSSGDDIEKAMGPSLKSMGSGESNKKGLHEEQQSETMSSGASPLPPCDDVNAKPSIDIPTPDLKRKRKKNNEQDENERPQKRSRKKVYWPKVIGQSTRRNAPKVVNESKTKRTPAKVDGDAKPKRTPKPKTPKSSKWKQQVGSEGKFDVSCCEDIAELAVVELEAKLVASTPEVQITLEEKRIPLPSTTKTRRRLKFEIADPLQEFDVKNACSGLGKDKHKRISRRSSCLAKVRKMQLNFPIRCKKKRIQKRKPLFRFIKKGKRSKRSNRRNFLVLTRFMHEVTDKTEVKHELEAEEEKHIVEDKTEEKHELEAEEETHELEAEEEKHDLEAEKEKHGVEEKTEEKQGVEEKTNENQGVEEKTNENQGVEEKTKEEVKRETKHGGQAKRKEFQDKLEDLKMIMKFLIKEFQSLKINDSHKDLVVYKNHDVRLVGYKGKKSRQLQGKVNLDEESLRVWKILMDGKEHHETDEEKKKYWEQERHFYAEKVYSFIYRMHLVLGNRSFSPWKGSVLDSVIGAFLTQNVSDHLSSSAYMSLAAKFPVKTAEARNENPCACDSNVDEVKTQDSSKVYNNRIEDILNGKKKKPDSPGMLFGKKKSAVTRKNIDQETKEREEKEEKEAEEKEKQYWEEIRKSFAQYCTTQSNHMNSVDWEAVRCAELSKVAEAIEGRGQHKIIAQRIQALLNKLMEMNGTMDLEWLRHAPPIKAKEYLLKVYGLGLKSVECIRLLSLQHHAFPVDVNVGRIAVRLGWVPLEPLPESLQIHLLDQYPIADVVQQYIWPRLCTLDQHVLYELHYQMITFGKVFCTKKQPNCNACPMRGECKHFASAFASAKLALPAPVTNAKTTHTNVLLTDNRSEVNANARTIDNDICISELNYVSMCEEKNSDPIIEMPASPIPEYTKMKEQDMEDYGNNNDDSEEITLIKLNPGEGMPTTYNYFDDDEIKMSRALVALTADATSIPVSKMKNVSRLRTERLVYVLPDMHPLLEGIRKREPDDPSPYLLVIWMSGELETLSCNNAEEANDLTVPGTLLIPCRTAMEGRFPLNGTYFQVNEVFADASSSINPINVPRKWIWNLQTRITYFGTSTSTILRGLSVQEIHNCFWKGFVCVRGFDRKTGAPRPLSYRFHLNTTNKQEGKKKAQPAKEQRTQTRGGKYTT